MEPASALPVCSRVLKSDLPYYVPVKRALKEAERFYISESVQERVKDVCSMKPSSIVSCLPLCRNPFHSTWIERRTSGFVPECGFSELSAKGVFIVTPEATNRGYMEFVFLFKKDPDVPRVAPFGLAFDFSENPDAGSLLREGEGMPITGKHPKNMLKFGGESEQMRALETISSRFQLYFAFLFRNATSAAGSSQDEVLSNFKAMSERARIALAKDTTEEAFEVIGYLCALNSKTGFRITQPPEPTKYLKRHPSRKEAFVYRDVTIDVDRPIELRTGTETESGRRSPRFHSVRGHFKNRNGGIYWWNPHFRGEHKRGAIKKEYFVESRGSNRMP